MRLSGPRFDAFLGGAVRQNFLWRRAHACPCVAPQSGSPRDDCPLCEGKGAQWDDPVEAFAGMTGLSPKRAVEQFGSYESGDATLTIPASSPMYAAGRLDRITALDSTNPFSMVIRPGLNDRLHGRVVSVERVFWVSPDGESNVEGGIPVVAADGSLSWTSGAPPAGVTYTISGVRNDELFVFNDLPGDRNIGARNLPRRAPVRKFDLFGRGLGGG